MSYRLPQYARRIRPGLAALAAAALCLGMPAHAQDSAEEALENPAVVRIDRGEAAQFAPQALSERLPAVQAGAPLRNAELSLDIVYREGRIYNPATRRHDRLSLRGYIDAAVPGRTGPYFIAPSIEARPGETVRMRLHNRLPAQPDCTPANINTPHCFNSTNLHSHGLWVSPTGNSDNVLLTLRPGVHFDYEYAIPDGHPAGTFWYHPHLHGSTALQVSSGMAGALIVRGNRLPRKTPSELKTGDIDTLLRAPDGTAYTERVVVFQQIQYACRDAKGNIKTNPDGTWRCDKDDVGTIESYDQFGPGSWPASGRYTTLNGRVLPKFTGAVVGRPERWRLIHAGVRDTINLQFLPLRAQADALPAAAADHDAWIRRNCVDTPLTQVEIATDGLTRAQGFDKQRNVLQPGYRSDVLMVFPDAGQYCVVDAAAPATATVNALVEKRQLLGKVQVRAADAGTPPASLQQQLVAAAERWMPAGVRADVVAGLNDGLKLAAFVPHPTITDQEVQESGSSGQDVVFNIDTSGDAPTFEVNGKPYDPDTARDLILGQSEQWTLKSAFVNHPFHIHVNPFQVVSIKDPYGNEVSVTGDANDPQYAGTQGLWKDTLLVKQGYIITMRTRYQRYIGEYVLHCHILDHEDQGMMQNVRVLVPDGQGGAIRSGHGGHGDH
jgi:L-ascorbate oxidase